MRYLLLVMSAALAFTAWDVIAQDAEEGAESTAPVESQEEQRRVRRLGDVISGGEDEFSMAIPTFELPQEPVEDMPNVSLPDPEQDARLQMLLRTRAFVPDDPDTQQAISVLLDEVEEDIDAALAAGDLALAQQLAGAIREVEPDRAIVTEVASIVEREASVGQFLRQGQAALGEGRLTTPPGNNAAELFAQVLEIEPNNSEAQAGLAATHQALLVNAVELARDELDFEAAEALLVTAESIQEAPNAVAEARTNIADFRQEHIGSLHRQVQADIDSGRYDEAESGITDLLALGHERAQIDALEVSLNDARLYGSFEPGQQFNDDIQRLGIAAPDMVVVPAGSFMMGSPDSEDERIRNEGPQHRVVFERGFALGRTEVTVGQFSAFINDTGYRTDAEIAGRSRVYSLDTGRMDEENNINWRHDYSGEDADDDLPVIHVSWRDATAYTSWLSDQTGRSYRLPSEAEFAYALRAGTQTPYWWGSGSPSQNNVENVTGDRDVSETGARWNVAFRRYSDGHWGPAPVASLQANPFGLYDMGGNVMEWVEDCWHDSFVRAPADGSAWVNPGCERRVIRGASWSSTPAMSRSAFRISSATSATDMRVGFRIARDL